MLLKINKEVCAFSQTLNIRRNVLRKFIGLRKEAPGWN